MKPDAIPTQEKPSSGVDLFTLYRSLLRIAENMPDAVAHLPETEYTETNSDAESRRAEVFQHSDSTDPASDVRTLQG